MQRKFAVGLWLGIFAVLAIPLLLDNYYVLSLFALIVIYAISAVGLNIWAGFHGELSLGQGGLFGVGAYIAAISTTTLHISTGLGLILACLATALVSIVIGLPALRVKGAYLVVLTLGFSIVVYEITNNAESITGGPEGIGNIPALSFWGLTFSPKLEYVIYLLILAVAVLAVNLILRCYWGRTIIAVKDSDIAALSLGVNTGIFRLLAFTLSGMLSGLAGALLAYHDNFISPETFSLQLSIMLLLMVIVGGRGTQGGPIVGSMVLTLLPQLVREFTDWQIGIYGALTLAILIIMPQGIVGFLESCAARLARPGIPGNTKLDPLPTYAFHLRGPKPPIKLSVEKVTKDFSGIRALDRVTIDFLEQGIHGLIGPNGSGKTTLINVVSGFYRADEGAVSINGRALGDLSPRIAARHGIARTFQLHQVFSSLTVLDNLLLAHAAKLHKGSPVSWHMFSRSYNNSRESRARAMSLLKLVGLDRKATSLAGELSYGQKRLLELARCLALDPAVLLLDEPAAGMNEEEVKDFGKMLLEITETFGLVVILCEHHFDLINNVCRKVSVLDMGLLIANGDISEVRSDPKVIAAYIGA